MDYTHWLDRLLGEKDPSGVSRRDFLKVCTAAPAAVGLPASAAEKMAEKVASGKKPPVIWLHFQECTAGPAGPPAHSADPAVYMAVFQQHLIANQVLLQAAAIQGEQFTVEVVARVLARDEQSVVGRLSRSLRTHHRLVEAFRQERLGSGRQRLSHYRFRHALVQRSAYSRLDLVERAQLHEATGRILEAIYTAAVQTVIANLTQSVPASTRVEPTLLAGPTQTIRVETLSVEPPTCEASGARA